MATAPAAPTAPSAATMEIEARVVTLNGDAIDGMYGGSGGGRSSKPCVMYRPPEVEWKDGLCACSSQLAPSCLIATCCPCLGLALVAQRLGWTGRWACNSRNPSQPFGRVLAYCVSIFVWVGFFTALVLYETRHISGHGWLWRLLPYCGIIGLVVDAASFLAHLLHRARGRLRLPGLFGGGAGSGGGESSGSTSSDRTQSQYFSCEDGISSLFCFPLVLARLLRHLFDFRGMCDSRWPLKADDVETLV